MLVDDHNPSTERLVTVLINNQADARTVRSYLVANRNDNARATHRDIINAVADTVLYIGNRQRRNNYILNCMNNRYHVPADHKIHRNVKRLTHYIQEANVGRGFIKELCYSKDGRIICSPFGKGVRMLSFSPNCDELSTLLPKLPAVKLHEIGTNLSHSNIVLCTKFSPVHPLLVSGCLSGRIVWYQPIL